MLPQQATDGGKAIWYQISSNVPSTRYEAQMFICNGQKVGKWKLGKKQLNSKTSPMPYCKQAGQPPRGSVNTWFSYHLLVTEDARKCLCSALQPQVNDSVFCCCFFFHPEQYFQLTCFHEKIFYPPSVSFSFTFNILFFSHALYDENPNWFSHIFLPAEKNV